MPTQTFSEVIFDTATQIEDAEIKEVVPQNVSATSPRKVTYKMLWKLLIDKEIKKKDLCRMANISAASITKMGRNGHVSTKTLDRICSALKCNIGDIVEIVS